MNPTHHDLRSYRKKTCLTQQDICDLLGTKDVSQISRHETNPVNPQLEICLLYYLLFDVPIHNFFPSHLKGIKKRLITRIPNILDELKCLPKTSEGDERINFLSEVLSKLISTNV